MLISCSLSFARPGFGHGKGKGRSSPAVFRWRPWKALQDPRQENAPIGAPSHIAWLLHRNFPGFHRASRRVRRSSCSPRQILYHNPADFAADAEFFCAARSLADPQGLQALHLHIRRPLKNLTQEFSQSLAISSGGGKYETSSDASQEARWMSPWKIHQRRRSCTKAASFSMRLPSEVSNAFLRRNPKRIPGYCSSPFPPSRMRYGGFTCAGILAPRPEAAFAPLIGTRQL